MITQADGSVPRATCPKLEGSALGYTLRHAQDGLGSSAPSIGVRSARQPAPSRTTATHPHPTRAVQGARTIARLADASGVPLFVVGRLLLAALCAGADRLVTDLSHIPAELHDETRARAALIIGDLLATPVTLDWVFVSPAIRFAARMPGERLGRYRLGDDVAVPPGWRRRDLGSGLRPRIGRPDRDERPPPGTGQPGPLKAFAGCRGTRAWVRRLPSRCPFGVGVRYLECPS